MRNLILLTVLLAGFMACKKERDCSNTVERTLGITNFKSISAGETFTLNVQQGTSFSVKAKGCDKDLDDLQTSIDNGGTLVIKYNRYQKDRRKVYFDITLPSLYRIILDGAATGTLTGFSRQSVNLRPTLNGAAECTIEDMPSLLNANLSGASKLTVRGSASDLIASVSGAANMNAYDARFMDADVYASGTAKIRIVVDRSLFATASGDSRVYYKGNPTANIEQSGTAKVIHE